MVGHYISKNLKEKDLKRGKKDKKKEY